MNHDIESKLAEFAKYFSLNNRKPDMIEQIAEILNKISNPTARGVGRFYFDASVSNPHISLVSDLYHELSKARESYTSREAFILQNSQAIQALLGRIGNPAALQRAVEGMSKVFHGTDEEIVKYLKQEYSWIEECHKEAIKYVMENKPDSLREYLGIFFSFNSAAVKEIKEINEKARESLKNNEDFRAEIKNMDFSIPQVLLDFIDHLKSIYDGIRQDNPWMEVAAIDDFQTYNALMLNVSDRDEVMTLMKSPILNKIYRDYFPHVESVGEFIKSIRLIPEDYAKKHQLLIDSFTGRTERLLCDLPNKPLLPVSFEASERIGGIRGEKGSVFDSVDVIG